MSFIGNIGFDVVLLSAMATIVTREALIVVLPDRIAGPEGWLIKV